jgi:hypothetical protein
MQHADAVVAGTAVDDAVDAAAFAFTISSLGASGKDAEPPQVARAGDDVFIIWHEFPPGGLQPDVFLARSTDKGTTFKPRINLSNTLAGASDQEQIAVTRSGNSTRACVVRIEDGLVRFRRDKTNDGTFSDAITLNDTLGANNAASPRTTASGNNVFVVWQAAHPGTTDPADIFFARSTDSGDSFKVKKNLSNNNGTSEGAQLTFLPSDKVIVAWRDNSNGDFEILCAEDSKKRQDGREHLVWFTLQLALRPIEASAPDRKTT